MLIQGKLITFGSDLAEAFDIRRKVFIEELGEKREEQFDDLDQEAMHVIVYEEDPNWKENKCNKIAVATGRIIFDGTNCMIEKVAVLKQYRGKQYGDFTVRMLLNRAFTANINQVSIITKDTLTGFFDKIGFQKESEVNIQGVTNFRMTVQSDEVITQCKKCR